MKKVYSCFLIAVLTALSISAYSQTIDSVTVGLSQNSVDGEPFVYNSQIVDSFSTGSLMFALTRMWENNSWINSKLYSYTYISNKLSEELYQLWDSIQWLNNWRNIYTYSVSTDSILLQTWNTQWTNAKLDIYQRNSFGKDSILTMQLWNNLSWRNFSKTESLYFPDSSLLSQTFFRWDTVASQWNFFKYKFWIKDALQRDSVMVEQNYVGGNWQNYEAYFYYYDSLGNVAYDEFAYWNPPPDSAWDLTYHTDSLRYDSLNRLIHTFGNDIPGSDGETYYYYDSLGVRFNNHSFNYANSGAVTESDYHLYYFTYPSSPSTYVFLPADYSICANDSSPIGAFAFAGTYPLAYSWNPSSGLSSDTIENPFLVCDTATMYVLTVTDALNNIVTDTINIGILPATVIDSIRSLATSCIGCSDGMFIVSASGGTSSFYNFSISPEPLGAVQHGDTILHLPQGIYTICATNDLGCSACTTDTILDSNVGITENDGVKVSLLQNPFSTYALLYCSTVIQNMNLVLFDASGRQIRKMEIKNNLTRIERENLSAGIYIGMITADGKKVGRIKCVID